MPTRIDFISKLPIDIAWNIFPRFAASELVEFSQVSHEWYDRILHCVVAWNELAIEQHSTTLAEILPLVAPFVRHLKVGKCCEMDCICDCLQLMRNGYFSHLKCLAFPNIDMDYMDENLDLLVAITKAQGTLTELVIGGNGLPLLEDILSNCSNLTHLAYYTSSGVDLGMFKNDFTGMSIRLKLTHLYLRIAYSVDMDCEEMERLLQRCPDIKFLDIGQCERSPLETIRKFIPNTEIISYGGYDNTSFVSGHPFTVSQQCSALQKRQISTDINNNNNSTAMNSCDKIRRSVFLNIGREQVDGAQMFTLLDTYKNELETLSIHHLDYDGTNPDLRWNPLLQFGSNTLQKLIFNVHGYPYILTSILRKCPSIRELELDNLYYFTDNDIDAIANVPSLHRCRFDSELELSLNNMIYFARCIQNRGSNNGLGLLELNDCFYVNNVKLKPLAEMTNLKGLKISYSSNYQMITSMSMQLFFEALSSNNKTTLEYICLRDTQFVDDVILNILGEICTLRRIELIGLYNITDIGIMGLVSSATSLLKHLHISNCSDNITNDTIAFCRRKISYVTYKK